MEVFALDEDYGLVTVDVPYTNLQWTRKYYQTGEFSMQVPAGVYDSAWAYIVTNDRPEVGMCQKVSYTNDGGEKLVQLSGFFAENKLDQVVAFPRFVTDKAATETAIKAMFDTFGVAAKKGLAWIGNETPLGGRTQCDFFGEKLGEKWHNILETREMSYRVTANNDFTALSVGVWQGLDRTQGQTANPWCVFSTKWGNVEGESATVDSSAFANVCRVSAQDGALQFDYDLSGGGERFETVLDKGSEAPEEGQSAAEFRAGLEQEAAETLANMAISVEVDVTAYGDSGYMVDYDLGDLVTLQIEDLGLDLESRIVEVDEVFKPEGHDVTLGFGTKRVSNIERAVRR